MGEIRDPDGERPIRSSRLGGLILPLILFGLIAVFILIDCIRR